MSTSRHATSDPDATPTAGPPPPTAVPALAARQEAREIGQRTTTLLMVGGALALSDLRSPWPEDGRRVLLPHQSVAATAALIPVDARTYAQLGELLGKGGAHTCHAVDLHPSVGGDQGRWVVLIAHDLPGWSHPTARHGLDPDHLRLAHRIEAGMQAHAHALAAVPLAEGLLPRYGGAALVLPSGRWREMRGPEVQIGALWSRTDATLEHLITQQGQPAGLAHGAAIDGRRLQGHDVAVIMGLLGEQYRQQHLRGLVYTDPKPANIGILLSDPAARPLLAGQPVPLVRQLVILDLEALALPGYTTDRTRAAETRLTAKYAAPAILAAIGRGGEPLKLAQADPRSDIFHAAAMSFALVTGHAPQEDAIRAQARQLAGGELTGSDPRTLQAVRTAAVAVRTSGDLRSERAELQAQVHAGRIPAILASTIADGLEGRIATVAEWIHRSARSMAASRA